MKYDFETLIPRKNMGSRKWNVMAQHNPNAAEDVIPLSVADMEFRNPPELAQGLKDYIDRSILGYTLPNDAFYQSVARWMKNRHQWDIKPEWLVQAPGVVNALFGIVKTFTEPGDGIIIMQPVYYPFSAAITQNGRELVNNALIYEDYAYRIDFDDLEKKAKDPKNKMLILCSPHNPIGRVWTREELEKVGRICIDNNVLVVSDEIHFDFILTGHKHTVFANISEEFAQHCIICTAPSKTFNIAGLKISNIVIPNDHLRKQLLEKNLGERLLLPSTIVKSDEDLFLDDYRVGDLETALQTPVNIVKSSGRAFVEALLMEDGGVRHSQIGEVNKYE